MAKNTKRQKEREVYKLKNWSCYNKSLKNRGKITFWFSEEVKTGWYYEGTQNPGSEINDGFNGGVQKNKSFFLRKITSGSRIFFIHSSPS